MDFAVKSSWFEGDCQITTYKIEELLGTKLRALYQRRKGRDLFDLHKALAQMPDLDTEALVKCYGEYMRFVVAEPPTQRQFLLNMEAKMKDREFLGDITALLRPNEPYDAQSAFEMVKTRILESI